jgi:hypothetical protein
VLTETERRGKTVTTITRVHEQLLSHRNAVPLDDDGSLQWIEIHDTIEEKIGQLDATTLNDVQIKLDILCNRLTQASVCKGDLMIAEYAKNDLKRLSFKYEN